jgi:hypothetical protein
VHEPKHFKLVVKSSFAKEGFMFLTPGGVLKEDETMAAQFEITEEAKSVPFPHFHQFNQKISRVEWLINGFIRLGKVVSATDPSQFFVGAEHPEDKTTSMGLLPYCTPQSLIKTFALHKCDCVTIGTGYFQHYLKWSDEKFTSGEAVFGAIGGAEPVEGTTVTARLSGEVESGFSLFKLYAREAWARVGFEELLGLWSGVMVWGVMKKSFDSGVR